MPGIVGSLQRIENERQHSYGHSKAFNRKVLIKLDENQIDNHGAVTFYYIVDKASILLLS